MQWQAKLPLIAILRGIMPDEALAHIGVAANAGLGVVETLLSSPQWGWSTPAIIDAYSDKTLIDTDTVLGPEQIDALARIGCQLIVTPNIHNEMIRRVIGYGVTVYPNYVTATETFIVLEAGTQALKIFPLSASGPQYIKALGAVLPPDVAVFTIDGVMPESLAQWINANCTGVSLGSDLYHAGQSIERIAQQTAAFVRVYREAMQ